jgi:hypothetical protein
MGIRHLDTGEYETVPVATSEFFESVWLPASQKLGLQYVSHFHDGGLTGIPSESVPDIVEELHRLRAWATENLVGEHVVEHAVERIDLILAGFARTDPAICEYDFG